MKVSQIPQNIKKRHISLFTGIVIWIAGRHLISVGSRIPNALLAVCLVYSAYLFANEKVDEEREAGSIPTEWTEPTAWATAYVAYVVGSAVGILAPYLVGGLLL